jgi:hypothetical protein
MHWPELRPETRISVLRLKLTNAMRVVTQVALTGMRAVTQDFGRNPSCCSYVKPVIIRGSTVYAIHTTVHCRTAISRFPTVVQGRTALQFCRHVKQPACSNHVLYRLKCNCIYAISKNNNKTTNIKYVDALLHQCVSKPPRPLSP